MNETEIFRFFSVVTVQRKGVVWGRNAQDKNTNLPGKWQKNSRTVAEVFGQKRDNVTQSIKEN